MKTWTNSRGPGRYNERLDYIKDFPKGWVVWQFDQTDMANAKKIVGGTCAIAGNVPASIIIITATAKQVKEECRKLIETCAPGGADTSFREAHPGLKPRRRTSAPSWKPQRSTASTANLSG